MIQFGKFFQDDFNIFKISKRIRHGTSHIYCCIWAASALRITRKNVEKSPAWNQVDCRHAMRHYHLSHVIWVAIRLQMNMNVWWDIKNSALHITSHVSSSRIQQKCQWIDLNNALKLKRKKNSDENMKRIWIFCLTNIAQVDLTTIILTARSCYKYDACTMLELMMNARELWTYSHLWVVLCWQLKASEFFIA